MLIDKNIPYKLKENIKYPFNQMDVGDSFFTPVDQSNFSFEYKTRGRISSAAANWSKKTGTKFSIRKEADGLRCWRIA